MWLVIITISVFYILLMITTYNRLNHLKIEIEEMSSNIGNSIELRASYLDDALQIATIGYDNEVEGIKKLTATEKYKNLVALGQTYPELNSTEGYAEALKSAHSYNLLIKKDKDSLNEKIALYNKMLVVFPTNMIAASLGFKKEEFTDEKHSKKNRKVIRRNAYMSKYDISRRSKE